MRERRPAAGPRRTTSSRNGARSANRGARAAPSSRRARGRGESGPPPDEPLAKARYYWRRFDKRWLVFIPALFAIWIAYSYARIAVTLTDPKQVIAGAQGIDILDRNGNLVFAFGDEPGSGRVVPLDQLSPYLVDATVASEDAEFWDHPGVNVKGLARAAYENVAFWETGGLFKGSGGSSITQQLAKNLYIKPEDRASRSPARKLNETLIAFELTRRYSKTQILEWYLANNYYGNGAYGIESASFRYFNKAPSELTLAEASFLAGIPRSPGYYDPIANFEAAPQRQEQVLGLMVRHHFISQQEMDEALAQPVALKEGRNPNAAVADDLLAPHFAEYVREQLPVLLGKENVQGHLTVTTTIELDLQALLDRTSVRLEGSRVLVNGRDVTGEIRDPAISQLTSRLTMLAPVRDKMTPIQRSLAEAGAAILEGRDTGSVVWPTAEVKFYLDADLDTRARRRRAELAARGLDGDLETVKAEMARRDRQDMERPLAPLVKPEGAVVVDTTGRGIAEVVDTLARVVEQARCCTRS
jgi:cytidylate kinase